MQNPPPPLGFPFETRTERGLRNMIRGMWIFGIFAALILLIMFITTMNPLANSGTALFSISFAVIAIILVFVSFINWILGFYRMFTARREYGPVHAHYVNFSSIFAGMYILSLFGHLALINMAWRFPGGSFFLFRMFIGLVSSSLLSLTWIYLILDLAPNELKTGLWLSLFISVLISFIAAIIGEASPAVSFFSLSLWYIVLFLVVFIYQKTYDRLKKKEILPILPPPIPFPMSPP